MPAATQISPPAARYRISSPTQRQAALDAADITALSVEWEPIGLGAITDLVQHAFGPVDLDRSPVELATVAAVHWGCPACAGGRFGFPGALAEAKAAMCPAHLREAESVINRRLARANAASTPATRSPPWATPREQESISTLL